MNLINDPWIPIRRKSGAKVLIAPWQLTEADDPVVALDAPRPDFNGALLQFLIGLLQTTATPATEDRWVDWLEEPPAPDALKDCFAPYAYAFDLQREQGAFMQDFDALDSSSSNAIAQLLIENPGDNAIKGNKDFFVKRGQVEALCPSCTAVALFALQINAPSGGQGHRTSLRGGGPLSTLVVPDEQSELPADLWRQVWLNVLNNSDLGTLSGDRNRSAPEDLFPWLSPPARVKKREDRKQPPWMPTRCKCTGPCLAASGFNGQPNITASVTFALPRLKT